METNPQFSNALKSNLERRRGHKRYVRINQALNFLSATNSEHVLHFDSENGQVKTCHRCRLSHTKTLARDHA